MQWRFVAFLVGYGKLWLLALLLVFMIGWGWANRESLSDLAPIRYIRIEGELNHIDPAELTKELQDQLKGGYFAVDLVTMEQRLKHCAWIDTVEAVRVWPDVLRLKVVEQKPVAVWGGVNYLNRRGELFAPGHIEIRPGLPRLNGPHGQEKRLLTMLYRLNETWKERGVKVLGLTLSERLAWILQLDSGLRVIFGKQDPLVASERLHKLLPRLGERRFAELHSVDVRYANGLALVWKQPVHPEMSQEPGEKSLTGSSTVPLGVVDGLDEER